MSERNTMDKQKAAEELVRMAREFMGAKKPDFERFVMNEVFADAGDGTLNGMMSHYQNMGPFNRYGIDPTDSKHIEAVKKEIRDFYEVEIEDAIGVFEAYVYNVTR